MNKIKTKVISSDIGRFDVDSITVSLDENITSICFDKSENISQYNEKDIYLVNNDGVYTVELYVEEKQIAKK